MHYMVLCFFGERKLGKSSFLNPTKLNFTNLFYFKAKMTLVQGVKVAMQFHQQNYIQHYKLIQLQFMPIPFIKYALRNVSKSSLNLLAAKFLLQAFKDVLKCW